MTGPKRVTEKQLAANRANAARSTGPRTAEGKAVSRWNALKHGVLAQAVIPPALEPYESRAEFEALLTALREELSPGSVIEELLVERVAVGYWRLGRVLRAEAGAIAWRCEPPVESPPKVRPRPGSIADLDGLLEEMGNPPEQRTLAEQLAELETYRSDNDALRAIMASVDRRWRDAPLAELRAAAQERRVTIERTLAEEKSHRQMLQTAVGSVPTPATADALARYETMVERQIHQSLATLERLQRLRGGEFVPPPVQLNVALDAAPDSDLSS